MHRTAKCLLAALVACTGMHSVACLAGQAKSSHENDAREIYGAFLTKWLGKSEVPVNVADTAAPPTQGDIQQFNECASAEVDKALRWSTHTTDEDLNDALGSFGRVHLMNPRRWHAADPGRLIAQGRPADAAVGTGIARGLMTLTAISFTETHDIAMFKYSFVCGGLCGHGGTVMFRKTPQGWVQSRRLCSGWMS